MSNVVPFPSVVQRVEEILRAVDLGRSPGQFAVKHIQGEVRILFGSLEFWVSADEAEAFGDALIRVAQAAKRFR